MTNISKHPCSNKCSNFKEEPCPHCLIMGDDQYIENHISPNCKIVSNDESIFYNRAMNAQREVS
ncbi:hypothetical protein EAH57_15025 [Acinetobacter sp. 2JN-4]|nr:hypothetical protein EAH57_15025 [Acinetobacter sp. 2JN-4]